MFIWILCSTYFCSWKVIYCSVERIFISTGRYELGSLLKHIKPSRVWTSTSINICDQLNIYNLLCEHHYLLWLFYIILLHGCSTCFCKTNFHSISYLLKLSLVWKGMLHTWDGIDWIAVFMATVFSNDLPPTSFHWDNFRERDAKKSERKRHI